MGISHPLQRRSLRCVNDVRCLRSLERTVFQTLQATPTPPWTLPFHPRQVRTPPQPFENAFELAGSENNNPVNWGASSSHIDNAKRALGQLEALVDDAVFLDDDTFNGMKTLSYYNQKLQVSVK